MREIAQLISDKIIKMEKASSFLLFCFSIMLALSDIKNSASSNTYVWAVSLLIVSSIQYIGIKNDKIIMRLIGAWLSFLIWTWLSFVSLNMFIYVTSFMIGIFNVVAFVTLANRISFHLTPNKEIENVYQLKS